MRTPSLVALAAVMMGSLFPIGAAEQQDRDQEVSQYMKVYWGNSYSQKVRTWFSGPDPKVRFVKTKKDFMALCQEVQKSTGQTGECDPVGGAFEFRGRIVVRSDMAPLEIAFALAHEVGHAEKGESEASASQREVDVAEAILGEAFPKWREGLRKIGRLDGAKVGFYPADVPELDKILPKELNKLPKVKKVRLALLVANSQATIATTIATSAPPPPRAVEEVLPEPRRVREPAAILVAGLANEE